jgi:5'-3' exonuclease
VKVHLVDGTFELFRCFHGAPRATGPTGKEVGAARGLMATLVSLLSEPDVTHVAVAFDSVVVPVGADKDYSTNGRIGVQQALAAQVVRALGVPVWPAGRFKADELISSAAALLHDHHFVDQVVICSTDNDFNQCVRGDEVVVLDRIRKVVTNEAAVRARYGVAPQQLPDLFALIGDRSDGIPGVPGWGLQSAAALLQHYGRVADIPLDPERWVVPVRGRDRLAATLRSHREEALLCRDLSELRRDLPVPAHPTVLEWHGAHRDLVAEVVAALGDDSAVERIPRWREP